MASFCFAWWIFHIISNPFNCSDTARRVAKAMIGVKEITRLCFAIYFCFCFSNFAPKLVPRIFGLFSSRKPGFPIRTQGEIRPGKRASPVNRAHTKRPKVLTTGASVTWQYFSRFAKIFWIWKDSWIERHFLFMKVIYGSMNQTRTWNWFLCLTNFSKAICPKDIHSKYFFGFAKYFWIVPFRFT